MSKYYLNDGRELNEAPFEKHTVCAKHIVTENLDRYFIALDMGHVMDPKKLSLREIKKNHSGFREVNQNVFNQYVNYLQNANATFSFRAVEMIL